MDFITCCHCFESYIPSCSVAYHPASFCSPSCERDHDYCLKDQDDLSSSKD